MTQNEKKTCIFVFRSLLPSFFPSFLLKRNFRVGGGIFCLSRQNKKKIQIVHYSHTLDSMSAFDFGYGSVCKYGTHAYSDDRTQSEEFITDYHLKNFCGRVVGFSGASLLLPFTNQYKEFKLCNYYIRNTHATAFWLNQDNNGKKERREKKCVIGKRNKELFIQGEE